MENTGTLNLQQEIVEATSTLKAQIEKLRTNKKRRKGEEKCCYIDLQDNDSDVSQTDAEVEQLIQALESKLSLIDDKFRSLQSRGSSF